jgi:hypothetical protein
MNETRSLAHKCMSFGAETMGIRDVAMAATILLAAQCASAFSFAIEQKRTSTGPTLGEPVVLIPGAMTGVETWGPVGYWRLCSPHSIALMEWEVKFAQRILRPNDTQKELLDELSVASMTAKSTIASSCQKETIKTTDAVLTTMEKRLKGLLEALNTIRPAYQRFYASLEARQRATLEALGPARSGWRW